MRNFLSWWSAILAAIGAVCLLVLAGVALIEWASPPMWLRGVLALLLFTLPIAVIATLNDNERN